LTVISSESILQTPGDLGSVEVAALDAAFVEIGTAAICGEVGAHGVLLPREVNRRALAEMLNTTRAAITREAAVLRQRGLLENEGHRVRVTDPDGLGRLASGVH